MVFRRLASKNTVVRNPSSTSLSVKDVEGKKYLSGWVLRKKVRDFVVVTFDSKIHFFKDLNTPAKLSVSLKEFECVLDDDRNPELGIVIKSLNGPENNIEFLLESESEKLRWKTMIASAIKKPIDEATIAENIRTAQTLRDPSKSSKWRVLYIKVIEARNLPAMDMSGTSDPFCYVTLGHEQRRTLTIWENNKNPLWAEEFELEILRDPKELTLKVDVLDEDLLTNDDNIGKVEIPIAGLVDQKPIEKWYTLCTPDKEHVSGDVRLQINKRENEIKVKLVEARNLAPKDPNGLSDPFVKLNIGKQKKKSKLVKKSLNPIYDEEFAFSKPDANQILNVTVWDWDFVGSNDYMGEFQVDLRTLPTNTIIDEWYTLHCGPSLDENNNNNNNNIINNNSDQKDLGEIKLKVQYKEELVLPKQAYHNLLNLLLNNMDVIIAYSDDVVLEKAEFARILVNIFDANNSALNLISFLTKFEIQTTPTPDVIFRGNTVVTKSIDYFMKLEGMKYLQNTLAPFVTEVMKKFTNKSGEVDPSKATKGEDVKKNVKKLIDMCTILLNCVFNALGEFPPMMRVVFANIRQQVSNKFLANQIQVVKYTAVSGFLFLRYFGPAILNPRLFGLLTEIPSQHASRMFTLVAKVIQNLANLVEFGEKEPYMKDLNPFIEQNIDRMKEYIDAVAVPPANVPLNTGDLSIWVEKELAQASWYLSNYLEKITNKDPNFPYTGQIKGILADIHQQRANEH